VCLPLVLYWRVQSSDPTSTELRGNPLIDSIMRLAQDFSSDKRLFEQLDVFVRVEEQCRVTHVTHVDHFHGATK